jgi:hypothetical protein
MSACRHAESPFHNSPTCWLLSSSQRPISSHTVWRTLRLRQYNGQICCGRQRRRAACRKLPTRPHRAIAGMVGEERIDLKGTVVLQ